MRHLLVITALSLFANQASAEATPDKVLAGAIVNTWTQAGLRVSEKPFDLAVQGNGFFVLRSSKNELTYSRHGRMGLNAQGILIHQSTKQEVVGYCDGTLEVINLSRFARDEEGSVVKHFKTELDGTIRAFYESGNSQETCVVALALFANPNSLALSKGHLLKETPSSGPSFVDRPQTEGRGSVYGSAIEELDAQMYKLNIKR